MNAVSGVERKERNDEIVLGQITDAVSIMDLTPWCRLSTGAIRGALERLLEKKLVTRKWDGNARFGRYLYRRAT